MRSPGIWGVRKQQVPAPGMLYNPVLWVYGLHPLHIEPQVPNLPALQAFLDRIVV